MLPEPFVLERFFAQHEFSAQHLLATSDCQGLAMTTLLELADADSMRRWTDLTLGYTESQGLPELREQIAAGYQDVSASEVLVAAPEEAISLVMNALLEPGDRVVCTFPGYQSLYQLALAIGCEVAFWEPVEDDAWRFDPDRLNELLQETTKLVVWNFPHNPTGALPCLADYESMLASARQAGAWVFSDEMYRLLERPADALLPAAVDCYERGISLAGMSKVYGLAGLRLGWVAAHDEALLKKMMSLKDYSTICSPGPSEILALMALRNAAPIIDMHRDRLASNVEAANAFFERHSSLMRWTPPQGGTICFPRLLSSRPSEEASGAAAFCERVLGESGVLLLPSTVYAYGDSHFRMGLGREDFAAGLEAFDSCL